MRTKAAGRIQPSGRQSGVSLIELMISIALGMVLMAASLQFIISTRQTYELNDDIARVQENGRIALDILATDLQMAGYRQPLNGDGLQPNFFLMRCNNTAGNADVAADDNAIDACILEGGGNISDRIALQYDPPPDDHRDTDCLGSTVPAESIIVNVYTIADRDGDGISSLYCQGYDATNESWVTPGPQPLVDGIDNMQVLYGVAGNATDPSSVTKYISADRLRAEDWPNLRAIRVALLVSNGTDTAFAEERERKYRLLDSNLITYKLTEHDDSDRQSRRIYSTTVQFNNYATQ